MGGLRAIGDEQTSQETGSAAERRPYDEGERYARQVLLPEFGLRGQRALAAAKVLVVGAGGLGSPALLYLAAAGVGALGIVDPDRVETSNLHRQVVHDTASVGMSKVDSAAARLSAVNPHVQVTTHEQALTAENAAELCAEYDIVLDGSDNFPTRYAVADGALAAGVPVVWASVLGMNGQVSVFAPTLGGPCYRCLFPEPPPAGAVPSCAENGVLGVVPGALGVLQASEAIKLLTGIGEPLIGRVLVYDAAGGSFTEMRVRRHPECPACGATAAGGRDRATDGQGRTAAPTWQGVPARAGRYGVTEIGPHGLAELMAAGRVGPGPEQIRLLDVRTDAERQIVVIEGDEHVVLDEVPLHADRLGDRPTVIYCRSGVRSVDAAAVLAGMGVTSVVSLAGGVLGWAQEIDPELPTY